MYLLIHLLYFIFVQVSQLWCRVHDYTFPTLIAHRGSERFRIRCVWHERGNVHGTMWEIKEADYFLNLIDCWGDATATGTAAGLA